jgi:hypothetical protein
MFASSHGIFDQVLKCSLRRHEQESDADVHHDCEMHCIGGFADKAAKVLPSTS